MQIDDVAIQLYTLRGFGDLDRQLAALAALGFTRVETIGGHLADASTTFARLEAHGMVALTGHVALADLRTRLEWVADQAKTIGIRELFIPAVPPEERDQPAERWRALGTELGGTAQRLAAHGLALGYHNHHWELVLYRDGTTPLAALFEGAAGSPLTFEADLAWLARGGADPVAWMTDQRARLTAVHVKDIAPAGRNLDEDGWSDIGAGTLDWPMLLREALAHGVRTLVLEHDKPKDPVVFARTGRACLQRLLG